MEKKKSTLEKIIQISIIVSFLILLMFDVFPGKAEVNRTIRVALYLVLDFTVSLFFMEGVVRFFLSWKKSEENPQNETFIKQTA